MSSVQLFGLRRCSTCVKARKWLDSQGIDHTFIDYRDEPVDASVLQQWARTLGWRTLINKASTSWRGLDDHQKRAVTDAEWRSLLSQTPHADQTPRSGYGRYGYGGFFRYSLRRTFRVRRPC